jgi:hypothetical protein
MDAALIINGLRIHSELLEEVQAERCVRHECMSACCSGGAWLDAEQLKSIVLHVEAIQANLPDDQRDPNTWFSAPGDDEDVPDGITFGTNVIDDPMRPTATCCVFLRPDRLCALQVTSEQIGLPYPGLKPLFCALYPLRIEHDRVFVDHETPRVFPDATCRRAASSPQPLYRLFQEELTLVLGEDGFRQLAARAVSDS